MELTDSERQLKLVACFLGIVQGLAYVILSIICIVLYNVDMTFTVTTYMENLNAMFYDIYFGSHAVFPNQTLHPDTFAIFAWIYFVLSVGWIGISTGVLLKKETGLAKYLRVWSYLTLLISLWDFITVVILGADYGKCLPWAEVLQGYDDILVATIGWGSVCANGILPVLVVAARGFVLWFVNVIFALIMNKTALRLKRVREVRMEQSYMDHPVQNPTGPVSYPMQPSMSHPSGYMRQPSQPSPYARPTPPNVNRGPFDFPVNIPEPDYYYNQQGQPQSILKKY